MYCTMCTGSLCDYVGSTKLPFGHHPLLLYNGEVSCHSLTGKFSIMRLATHNFPDDHEISTEQVCYMYMPHTVCACTLSCYIGNLHVILHVS